MHITATVDVKGRSEDAMATVLRSMLRLGWDIESQADLWVKAETGEWWEKKVEVEVVVAGGAVTIDAEPKSSVGVGPAWRQMTQRAVDELVAALGGNSAAAAAQKRVEAVKVPLKEQDYDAKMWRDMAREADESAPLPAPVEQLVKTGGPVTVEGGGSGGRRRNPVGEFLWWVVKEAAGAIVAIGVGKAADGDGGDTRSVKGKLEYDLHSGNMLVRFQDGSVALAPKEFQPGGYK